MITARQHIPAFVTGVEPETAVVANTADLLALPWVSRWETFKVFHRWAVSRSGPYLMAELKSGKEWYVVAYLSGDPVALPERDGGKH